MGNDSTIELLKRAGLIQAPCDLDLLLFFSRHPRSLLASESLAAFLGYSLKQIADSLERFLAAGVLERRQTFIHAARLYTLKPMTTKPEWLDDLVDLSSRREGRLSLMNALKAQSGPGTDKIIEAKPETHLRAVPRPFAAREDPGRLRGRKRRAHKDGR